jgi:hypothetical protein
MNNKLLSELKKSSQMEKFNFFASIITVSGVSIFTVVSGIDKIDTFRIGIYLILSAILLTTVSLIIFVYIWVINSLKKDVHSNFFIIMAFLLTLFALGFILIIVTTGWTFITNINIVS